MFPSTTQLNLVLQISEKAQGFTEVGVTKCFCISIPALTAVLGSHSPFYLPAPICYVVTHLNFWFISLFSLISFSPDKFSINNFTSCVCKSLHPHHVIYPCAAEACFNLEVSPKKPTTALWSGPRACSCTSCFCKVQSHTLLLKNLIYRWLWFHKYIIFSPQHCLVSRRGSMLNLTWRTKVLFPTKTFIFQSDPLFIFS